LDYTTVTTVRPKLNAPYIGFFGAILLMAYSLFQFTRPAVPGYVPWIMLFLSLVIFLGAAWITFRSGMHYRIVVTLLDGEKIPVTTDDIDQAQGLLDGLTEAMDWHRSGDVLIDAERVSHIKKSHASARVVGDNADSSDEAADEQAEHPTKVMSKIPPVILGMLKGRD